MTLDRFKSLLAYQAEKLHGSGGARIAVAVLKMESTTVIVKSKVSEIDSGAMTCILENSLY